MVAEKDKEDCKKFADIFMSLPEDSKNMVIMVETRAAGSIEGTPHNVNYCPMCGRKVTEG